MDRLFPMWKIIKIGALVFLSMGIVLAAIIGGWLYTNIGPNRDISPSAYPWEKGVSEEQVDRMARTILEQMTVKEKIDQMSGDGIGRFVITSIFKQHSGPAYSGANDRLGIPPISFTDGPRGITVGRSTSFPVAMARAAAWDIGLEGRVGDAMGKEARALGANYFGGLCINLLRHPSGGRAQESYGEDPWLMGEMAVALLQAIQHHNVMACAKHYALNNMETARFEIDVEVDERTLREVYLPHFRKCVENDVASIMSAYNRVRGEYCGHNWYLLTKILRDDWGFKGFVTSDWMWGLRDGVKGVKAGMDVEMPTAQYYGENLQKLVENGEVTEEEIDQIVFRILRTKIRYVTREDPMEYDSDLVAHSEHTSLAREVAEKGMVLLKNEGNLLPWSKEKIDRIAVVGELADADNTGDRGSSNVNPPYLVTPLAGIQDYLAESAEVLYSDGNNPDQLRDVVQEADVVLVIAGYTHLEEGEYINMDGTKPSSPEEKVPIDVGFFKTHGGDRYPLSLKDRDLKLINTVSEVNPNFAVALIGGSAITMEEWKEKTPAILMAWYFGMEGGNALARILFGDVNPSGKLPFTIPADDSQLPFFDEYADSIEYDYYHGYTLIDKKGYQPAFPFGFGLSYTEYDYQNLRLADTTIPGDGSLEVSVDVSNVGQVAGEEVVQLYIGFQNSAVDRPVKLLRDFKKVAIPPGETRTVKLSVQAKELAWFNPEAGKWEIEEMPYEVYVGPSSSPDVLLKGEFLISLTSSPEERESNGM